MKQLSREVLNVLRRAQNDDAFAESVVSDADMALRLYEITPDDLEYLRSLNSKELLQREYKEYLDARATNPSERLIDTYSFAAIIFILVLTIFITASYQLPQFVANIGLPTWQGLNSTAKTIFLVYAGVFFLMLLMNLRRRFGRLPASGRIAVLIGAVVLIFIPGSVLIGAMPFNARIVLIRILLVLLFTILPASLYYLFISTRGKTLWDEFVVNLSRLDPVGYKNLIPVYRKKFAALYGSPDQSGFGSALLQGEASFPVLFATFLLGLGWFLFFSVATSEDLGQAADKLLGGFVSPFTFGFLGAYLFSLQMLFRRYVQSDLKSIAYAHVSQRILLTWVWAFVLNIMPWTKMGLSESESIAFVSILAFMVGVFPDIAWQIVTQFVQRILSIVLPSFREKNPMHDIDGITVWSEARLLEEDIENIENLITAGIVDLLLRTNLKPERLIHWIDQGVLRLHLGRDAKSELQPLLLQALGDHCIVTATDLIYSYKTVMRKNRQEDVSKVFLTEQLDPLVRNLVAAIEDDPNMYHVLAWREMNAKRIAQLPEAVKPQIELNVFEFMETPTSESTPVNELTVS